MRSEPGWIDYYFLLRKYSGDLTRMSLHEKNRAARRNLDDPYTALSIAQRKYNAERRHHRL